MTERGAAAADGTDPRDKKIADLEAEIVVLKDMNQNHPEVTRFAMRNLALQERIKEFERAHPNHAEENTLLADARA